MTRETVNGIVVLTADTGKWLTNGETYSEQVYIGKKCNETEWREVNERPQEEDEPTAEEVLDIIMGVSE